jgi:hypothetical protein
VKYSDLSHDPATDIDFSWDKALALEGNSGPYLQYAYARVCSLMAKAGLDAAGPAAGPFAVGTQGEKRLALQLLEFPGAVVRAAEAYKPSVLADYLFQTAQLYSSFYQNAPILKSDAAVRDAMFATLYGPDGKRNKKEVSAMNAMKLFADSRFNKVMANVITIRPQGVPEDVFAARVRKLVDECGEDPDMLDAIECNARRFLVTGDSKLRAPEDIAERVTAYKSTLREMFAVAENNPAMRAAVKEMSTGLAGVVLPKDLCAKVIEEAKAVDLTPFENLDETSVDITIHNAVMALNKAVNEVIKNAGAIDAL